MTREELRDKVDWEDGTAAWARLYHQGREDIRTIDDWLYDDLP
jgi:hypothetical protein